MINDYYLWNQTREHLLALDVETKEKEKKKKTEATKNNRLFEFLLSVEENSGEISFDCQCLALPMPSTEMNADKPFELVQKTYHLQAQTQPIENSSQNRPSIVRVSNHQPSRKTSVHDVQEATRDDFNRVNVLGSARSLTSLFLF